MNKMWKNKIAILLLLFLSLCLISSCGNDNKKETVVTTEDNGGSIPSQEIDLSVGEVYYRYENGKKQDGFIQLIGKNEWRLGGGYTYRFTVTGKVITFNKNGHVAGRGVFKDDGKLTIVWTHYDPYTNSYQFDDERVLYKKDK